MRNAEMNQTHFWKKINDRSMLAIAKAGVNVTSMTASAKLTGKLSDVNAHAAGVIRSQISEGVGMDTEHLFFQPPPGL